MNAPVMADPKSSLLEQPDSHRARPAAEEFAAAILWLASDEAATASATTLVVDGGQASI